MGNTKGNAQEKHWEALRLRRLERIRAIKERKEKGMTNKQIAEELGLTQASVSSYWSRRGDLEETNEEAGSVADSETDNSAPMIHDPNLDEKSNQSLSESAASSEPEHSDAKESEQSEMEKLMDCVKNADIHYLIDTENINEKVIEHLLQEIPGNAMVHFFYTYRAIRISYKTIQKMMSKKDQIRFIPCSCGEPNMLDFQIVTVLGAFLNTPEGRKKRFVIVTNDRGYDGAVDFWAKLGMSVIRCGETDILSSELKKEDHEPNVTTNILECPPYEDTKAFDRFMRKITRIKKRNIFMSLLQKMENEKPDQQVLVRTRTLLKEKGLEGYKVGLIAQIFVLKNGIGSIYQQELMQKAFGITKTAEFYAVTTKDERKSLWKDIPV